MARKVAKEQCRVGFTGGKGKYSDKDLLPFSFSYAECSSHDQAYATAARVAEQLKARHPEMTWLDITLTFGEKL